LGIEGSDVLDAVAELLERLTKGMKLARRRIRRDRVGTLDRLAGEPIEQIGRLARKALLEIPVAERSHVLPPSLHPSLEAENERSEGGHDDLSRACVRRRAAASGMSLPNFASSI
jgi:hypothetical protein